MGSDLVELHVAAIIAAVTLAVTEVNWQAHEDDHALTHVTMHPCTSTPCLGDAQKILLLGPHVYATVRAQPNTVARARVRAHILTPAQSNHEVTLM